MELDQIVRETETRDKRWSGDQSAAVLEVGVRDREAHQLWFLGADDDPHFEQRIKLKRAKAAARARKYRADRSKGRPCGRPRLDLTESEKKSRMRRQSAESSARQRAAKSSGAKRGRPKAKVAAWKVAGFNSKRTYQRHKAHGTKNASGETASRDIKDIDRVTEFSVTDFKCQLAERLKRDGADHRPIVFEGQVSRPETGGFALAAPPPSTDRISPTWTVT
jgi:hypothetical protein